MGLELLIENIRNQYKEGLPFVLFSLPESESIMGLLQKDSQIYETDTFTTRGVVIAPFKFDETAFCIPEEHSDVFEVPMIKESIDISEIRLDESNEEKNRYIQLVKEALQAIVRKRASKIVLSRQKKIPITQIDFTSLVTRLFNLYPTAFRYIWYHPKTGLWAGASPEVLVKTENTSFFSMALAGTQKILNKVPIYWSDKEITEQYFVTEAITNSLQKVSDVLKVSKTYTYEAGSVAHLRTDITGVLKNKKATLKTISAALHPTPAVCGTPKIEAKNFIFEHEGYDREFYTGFIGPICGDNTCSNLFVNLRCMKIDENQVTLFSGGGITSDSEPIGEWLETVNKLQTMLQVIQPML
jgi:isochorismate synthase